MRKFWDNSGNGISPHETGSLKPVPATLQVGTVTISPATVLAPMAGVTDTVFRRFIRNLGGCGLIMTEFTSADGVLRKKDQKAKRYLHFYEDEHPISAQLFGSDPQVMADAARMVEDLGFDLVDLNLGCPAKKVVKCNGGSGLLRDLPADRQDFRSGPRRRDDSLHREIPRRMERRRNRLRRTGAHGRRLRTRGRRAACPHPRTGLQRPGPLGVDRRRERRREDPGDRQRRHPHAPKTPAPWSRRPDATQS